MEREKGKKQKECLRGKQKQSVKKIHRGPGKRGGGGGGGCPTRATVLEVK